MKSIRRITVEVTLGLWALGAAADSYFSAQHADWPPMPDNFVSVPTTELSNGNFLLLDQDVDYLKMQEEAETLAAAQRALLPAAQPNIILAGTLDGAGECASELSTAVTPGTDGNTITLTITNATDGVIYDMYRTFELMGDSPTQSAWRWVGRGTNGETIMFLNVHCDQAFYVLGCGTDSDGDGLTDAFEKLVSKTSPTTNHTYSAQLTDLEWWLQSNILVNDPEQDCGNEQDSQFETTCVVVGSNVVVAWVDSNQGVYDLGHDPVLTNRTPRLVAYAISRDGGVTFEDKGVPPLSRAGGPTNTWGDAGDPVLAVDRVSEAVYLAGTSPRNAGWAGIPLWKSTDGGVNFADPTIVGDEIQQSDKPWLAVDDWPGTGQHDVYLTCNGNVGASPTSGVWLAVSTDGVGGSWTNPPIAIRERAATNLVGGLLVQVAPDHVTYAVWSERTTYAAGITNWIKTRQVRDRGMTLGEVHTVCQLATTNQDLGLKRSNTAAEDDIFRALPLHVSVVNPATNRVGHLYVAFPDEGDNPGDKADIYFVASTNGGTNWTAPVRVNTDSTTNDQWMPVLAVKPDGTQLFMAWYDRRNDRNNSLIEFYGRWGTIASNGYVTFGTEFKITSTNFPPVFAGTDTNNAVNGHYDPVYPPGGANLNWLYPEWPLTNFIGEPYLTSDAFRSHVGEYNGDYADNQYVYLTWTDYRLPSPSTLYSRNQSDIRFVRITWPQ